MPADEVRAREAARTRVFDAAQALAAALTQCNASERWEPLRDLMIAGLQAGGFHHVADSAAVRTASGESPPPRWTPVAARPSRPRWRPTGPTGPNPSLPHASRRAF